MFFETGLRPEILTVIQKSKDHLTINACLEAGIEAEMALSIIAEYNKAFKSTPKCEVVERGGNNKGKSKACHDSDKSHSL
jgi:microcystin degradation protein MlrC